MQTNSPIEELSQIECTIQALHQCSARLIARHDALTAELDRITKPRPEPLDAATRSYVSKVRAELFPYKSAAWVARNSRALVEGWFVDTNLNLERKRRILPLAVQAAGLRWNDDVRIYWRRTPIPG